jgi:hypothetical protein
MRPKHSLNHNIESVPLVLTGNTMEEGGLLMLGAAETVIGQTQKFRASKAFRGFYELAPDQQGA